MVLPQAIPILGQMEDTPVQVSHLWSGGCHIWTRAAGLTSVMAWEVTRIVAPFWPSWRLFESDSNNGPSSSHSSLVSDEIYICSDLLLMVSWLSPYLVKGPRPDFNSGPGNDSNINCILALQRLLESNLNNSPSRSHSNLVSGRVYIWFRSSTYGFLVGAISAQGLQAWLQ